MQRWQFFRDSLGGLALVGALMLASPGVQVAHADSARDPAGVVCSTAKLRQELDPSLESFLSTIRRQANSRLTSEERDPKGWVVLNNRGYNYSPAIDLPQEGSASPPASHAN